MRGSATLTTVESMNATSEPRIAEASVSRFCATVTEWKPNLREDLSGPDADLSLHCHLKGLRLQRLPVTTLLLIPLDDTVVFPTMDVTLPVDVGDEDRVVLVPRHEGSFAQVGTIARVADRVRLPGGIRGASLEGVARGVLGAAQNDGRGRLLIEVEERPDAVPVDGRTRELEREYRAVVDEILDLRREVGRLERMGEGGGEASMIRTYLDWLIAVPWSKRSEDKLDPVATREVLDADHAGLEDVKDRVVEYVAVKKLREERGIQADKKSGAILTLIGPPGTGKTSIGESIARAMGREFMRMSLGGVRDEAEIRGHRRTYIGALPGRLVRALRDAGTMNPVILLDEVDKVGADWRGDPSAALLEVLDPAQNSTFRDHYLDVELDLSQVVFIATANTAETIPGPLLDRMEVIPFDGYTTAEKVAIARGYLFPRQRGRNGLREDEVTIPDDVIELVVREYTREAGVRNLERELGKVLRKVATKIASGALEAPVAIDTDVVRDALGRQKFFQEAAIRTAIPGVATGLAVTGVGGDVLFVEATTMKGTGGLVLTGQLGDVMEEAARIALSHVRSQADEVGIDEHPLHA